MTDYRVDQVSMLNVRESSLYSVEFDDNSKLLDIKLQLHTGTSITDRCVCLLQFSELEVIYTTYFDYRNLKWEVSHASQALGLDYLPTIDTDTHQGCVFTFKYLYPKFFSRKIEVLFRSFGYSLKYLDV